MIFGIEAVSDGEGEQTGIGDEIAAGVIEVGVHADLGVLERRGQLPRLGPCAAHCSSLAAVRKIRDGAGFDRGDRNSAKGGASAKPPVLPSWYCHRSQSRPVCADACAVTRAAVRSSTFGVSIPPTLTPIDQVLMAE